MKKKTSIIIVLFIVAGFISSCKIFNKGQGNKNAVAPESQLKGNWELNYISGTRIAFEGLFPNNKPSMSFDLAKHELQGNTGCNGFGCKTTIEGNKIHISEPGPMTMRYCEGGGEKQFLDMLKKVTSYNVNENTLTLIQGDIAVMRFTRR